MTPLKITMMLHYYAIAAPYSEHNLAHARSSAVHEQRQELLTDGMIFQDDGRESGWGVTEKGRAYVDALLAIPLPVCKWVIPS